MGHLITADARRVSPEDFLRRIKGQPPVDWAARTAWNEAAARIHREENERYRAEADRIDALPEPAIVRCHKTLAEVDATDARVKARVAALGPRP